MMHTTRVHRVTEIADDQLETLAERLQSIVHTCCTAYRWRGLLILNDATSEDGAQEYAIVRETTGRQIESLTCSWYETPERLAKDLLALARGEHWPPLEEDKHSTPIELHLGHGPTTCRFCA